MKLVSEEILPENKRKTASKEDWKKAFLELEGIMMRVLDDGASSFYDAYSEQLEDITRQVRELKIDITEEDSPGLAVFKDILFKSKGIFEGLGYVRENSAMSRFLAEKTKASSMRDVEN